MQTRFYEFHLHTVRIHKHDRHSFPCRGRRLRLIHGLVQPSVIPVKRQIGVSVLLGRIPRLVSKPYDEHPARVKFTSTFCFGRGNISVARSLALHCHVQPTLWYPGFVLAKVPQQPPLHVGLC